MSDTPWSPASFEDRYRAAEDPWSFATDPYEQGRYAAIEAALRPAPHHYRSGYEPGCSIGVLTDRLAARCDALTATDVSPTAVRRAKERCGDRPGLTIETGSLQDGPGTYGPPDLIVLSELGYYLSRNELRAVTDRLATAAAPGGDLIACHWTGHSPDHRLHGTEVHALLRDILARHADPTRSEVHDGFVLDAWRFR
jgi:SAM-dependent methyltransferase